MADIVPFPREYSRSTGGLNKKPAFDAARARRIEEAAQNNRPLGGPEQCQVAENLFRLLSEFAAGGISKLAVAQLAGLANEQGSSTKRLDTYTLPPDVSGPERERRVGRLAKRAKGYLRLTDALARLSGRSKDELISRMFQGTDYAEDYAPPDVSMDDKRWVDLAALLRAMCRHLVQQHGMHGYWKEVFGVPGHFDVRSDRFLVAPSPLYALRRQFGLNRTTFVSDEAPPVPSVVLARSEVAIRKDVISIADGPWEPCFYRLWLETRLAIGPVDSANDIGPLLESRSVLDAVLPEGPGERTARTLNFDNPFTDGSDTIRSAKISGIPTAVRVCAPEFPPLQDEREHSDFSFVDLTPATLRSALLASFPHAAPFERPTVDFDPDLYPHDRPTSWFDWTEPAYFVETAIHTGSMERALGARCDELCEFLEAHKQSLKAQVDQEKKTTLERWAALDRARVREERQT